MRYEKAVFNYKVSGGSYKPKKKITIYYSKIYNRLQISYSKVIKIVSLMIIQIHPLEDE